MKVIPPKPGSRTRGWGYSEPRFGAEVDGPHGKLCEARRLGQAGRDGIPEAMCPAVFVCTGRSVASNWRRALICPCKVHGPEA